MVEQVTFQTIFQFLQTVGILVGVYYYIMTIRANQRNQQMQLETRQAQLIIQLWNDAEKYNESGKIWRNLEYHDFDDFWKRYSPEVNPDIWKVENSIMSWYERMGVLVKAGLLDIHLIALSWAGTTRAFWEKFEPLLDGIREKFQYPRMWSETEYLCKELMKYMDEHPELKT